MKRREFIAGALVGGALLPGTSAASFLSESIAAVGG
jgi:hypothetical protein